MKYLITDRHGKEIAALLHALDAANMVAAYGQGTSVSRLPDRAVLWPAHAPEVAPKVGAVNHAAEIIEQRYARPQPSVSCH